MYTLLWFPTSYIPLALSFHFLGKESECSYHQAKTKPTWITVCLFTSAFQQKSKHISHFYASFRVKIPLKIETLQATFTRNTQDYSLMNALWPELVFSISELLWFLLFCRMWKEAPSTCLESVSLTTVWNRAFTGSHQKSAFPLMAKGQVTAIPARLTKQIKQEHTARRRTWWLQQLCSSCEEQDSTNQQPGYSETRVECRIHPYSLLFKNCPWNVQADF